MRIYIAGPMTGYEDNNYPAFNAFARTLRNAGWEVENPAETIFSDNAPYEAMIRSGLAQLLRCEAIWMLPGWTQSKGAMLEFQVAVLTGMQIKGSF